MCIINYYLSGIKNNTYVNSFNKIYCSGCINAEKRFGDLVPETFFIKSINL
jgi:hypothetical protein